MELDAALREARALDRAGDHGRAALAYKLILRAQPHCLEARRDLGGLLMDLGRFEEARALCLEVLDALPADLAASQNLVGALLGLERFEEAEAVCRRLLAQDPRCAPAVLGLGMGLAAQGRHAEAEAAFLETLALDPREARARRALLPVQAQQKAWDRAYRTWMAIADLDLEGAQARFERACVHLLYGEPGPGRELYESRFDPPNDVGPRLDTDRPLWDGAPFPGRTLLLHFEQGLGDTLMAIRFAAPARARGGRVLALVQPPLLPVLRTCPGVDAWLVPGEPLPPFDLHLPLLSLPRVVAGTLPAQPYLRAPAGPREAVAPSTNLKVGLVWAGGTAHRQDFRRTLPAEVLAPLAEVPGVDWYSLQVGYEGDPPWAGLRDLGPGLTDFGATARALEHLDLLITVDTAVAHLAGAMGRPAWLLLNLIPDWRWLLEREDSPWYPTLRLFRQSRLDAWDDVVARIRASLTTLMRSRRGT
jgi:tetratricopeptide (TPR) repeat protein